MRAINIIELTTDEFQKIIAEAVREEVAKLQQSQTPPKQQEYLTRNEVSALLRILLVTLSDYTKKGILIGNRIGGRVLYKKDEVEGSIQEIQSFKYRRGA